MHDSFEASLAPHEGDLLSLPFDQYGRMRVVQNILHLIFTELAPHVAGQDAPTAKLSVLDVGGYPGTLGHFISKEFYDLSVLDVAPDDGSIPGYKQGSGMELPYNDTSFDIAVSLDTLEHIPNADRDKFLHELMRVARHAVVLVNPVQSVEADLAEETLNEYIRWILDAQQEQLAEHREYGLPNFSQTATAFSATGWKTLTFPIANVHNWLFMMVAKHYLLSMRDERATAFERTLDRFYNLTFTEGDRAEPAYRGVLVAVSPVLEPALAAIQAKYPPVPSTDAANTQRLQLTQVLMGMLNLKLSNHEDRLLREQIEHRDKHISGMEGRIALLNGELDRTSEHASNLETMLVQVRQAYETEFAKQAEYIARLEQDRQSKDEHVRYLEKLLEGIESGRVMRLTRTISRFLGRH